MTPKALIDLLNNHLERKDIFIMVEGDDRVLNLTDKVYILFSQSETNRNQATNKTAPLVLLAKNS